MQLDKVRQSLHAKESDLQDRADADRLRPRVNKIRTGIDDVQAKIDQIEDESSPNVAQAALLMVYPKMDAIATDIQLLNQDII